MISYVIIDTTNSISGTKKTLKLINRLFSFHYTVTNYYYTFNLVLFPIFKYNNILYIIPKISYLAAVIINNT